MMGRAGRPQYDDEGVAVILVHDQKKHFYKKFLYEPFPVESRYDFLMFQYKCFGSVGSHFECGLKDFLLF